MKITLNIDDTIIEELKREAARQGRTMSELVKALLAELGEGTAGFVFVGARGRAVHGLDGAMRAICSKLGVERATPHDLRRTFSTTVTGLGFHDPHPPLTRCVGARSATYFPGKS